MLLKVEDIPQQDGLMIYKLDTKRRGLKSYLGCYLISGVQHVDYYGYASTIFMTSSYVLHHFLYFI